MIDAKYSCNFLKGRPIIVVLLVVIFIGEALSIANHSHPKLCCCTTGLSPYVTWSKGCPKPSVERDFYFFKWFIWARQYTWEFKICVFTVTGTDHFLLSKKPHPWQFCTFVCYMQIYKRSLANRK